MGSGLSAILIINRDGAGFVAVANSNSTNHMLARSTKVGQCWNQYTNVEGLIKSGSKVHIVGIPWHSFFSNWRHELAEFCKADSVCRCDRW